MLSSRYKYAHTIDATVAAVGTMIGISKKALINFFHELVGLVPLSLNYTR
ncbi:hypothetical protein [Wolbachia endosymbiont of Cantharis cryptica]